MFLKIDWFGGEWGRGLGNCFCRCKINGHTLHERKQNKTKQKNKQTKNNIKNSPDWEPGDLASDNDLVNVYDNFKSCYLSFQFLVIPDNL